MVLPKQAEGVDISADAVELQVRDNQGGLIPAASFSARGGEMGCSAYGLLADGRQHAVWVLFVDDGAARAQRAASAALTHAPAAGARALPDKDFTYLAPVSGTKRKKA
jgi:hypothetical protein